MMNHRFLLPRTHRLLAAAGSLLVATTSDAHAGMPSVTLTDLARMRLDAISFFLAVLVACSLGVRLIWNSFARDFETLPPLSFGKAFGLVTLWGMLCVVVLTMISGARELMTPGAWQKDGFTYSLSESDGSMVDPAVTLVSREDREAQLKALWGELSRYALQNAGRFPSLRDAEVVPPEYWSLPDLPTVRYHYLEGRSADVDAILAFEPAAFEDGQLALMTSGEVRIALSTELAKEVKQGGVE